MGISILEQVLIWLRENNIQADIAYPGQKYPVITQPVAAVHIDKVERSKLLVTLEITMICPAGTGGTQCEMEALRVTEVLRWHGGSCVQSGCRYDGLAQVYCVDIQATFNCITEADDFAMGPGFRVYIEESIVPFAIEFSSERTTDHVFHYQMGKSEPVGMSPAEYGWKLTLVEMIPTGSLEVYHPAEIFCLQLDKCTGFREIYYHCKWISSKREFTREGLKRTRVAICMSKEDTIIE